MTKKSSEEHILNLEYEKGKEADRKNRGMSGNYATTAEVAHVVDVI